MMETTTAKITAELQRKEIEKQRELEKLNVRFRALKSELSLAYEKDTNLEEALLKYREEIKLTENNFATLCDIFFNFSKQRIDYIQSKKEASQKIIQKISSIESIVAKAIPSEAELEEYTNLLKEFREEKHKITEKIKNKRSAEKISMLDITKKREEHKLAMNELYSKFEKCESDLENVDHVITNILMELEETDKNIESIKLTSLQPQVNQEISHQEKTKQPTSISVIKMLEEIKAICSDDEFLNYTKEHHKDDEDFLIRINRDISADLNKIKSGVELSKHIIKWYELAFTSVSELKHEIEQSNRYASSHI